MQSGSSSSQSKDVRGANSVGAGGSSGPGPSRKDDRSGETSDISGYGTGASKKSPGDSAPVVLPDNIAADGKLRGKDADARPDSVGGLGDMDEVRAGSGGGASKVQGASSSESSAYVAPPKLPKSEIEREIRRYDEIKGRLSPEERRQADEYYRRLRDIISESK